MASLVPAQNVREMARQRGYRQREDVQIAQLAKDLRRDGRRPDWLTPEQREAIQVYWQEHRRNTLAVVGLFILCAVSVVAQTFPLTVKAYWNPNPVGDAVTGYTLTVDGGPPIAVGTAAINDVNCPVATYPAGCIIVPVTILAAGQHTFVATASNAWATSAPATAAVNINSPGQIVWIKIAK